MRLTSVRIFVMLVSAVTLFSLAVGAQALSTHAQTTQAQPAPAQTTQAQTAQIQTTQAQTTQIQTANAQAQFVPRLDGAEVAFPIAEVEQQLADLTRIHDELRIERENLEQQFEVLQGSRMLHLILQEARSSVREVRTYDYEELLAQMRLDLYYSQRQLRESPPERNTAEFQQHLEELEQHISVLVALIQTQQLLVTELAAFENIVEEYLFWTPSNRPVDLQWLRTLPGQLAGQMSRIHDALSELGQQTSVQFTPLLLILFLLLVLIVSQRQAISRRLATYDAKVAARHANSPWLIPRALALHALQVLPASLVVLIAAQFINAPAGGGIHLDRALNAVAGSLFVVSFMLRILRPGGFTELYFRWEAVQREALRVFILRFAWVLVPLSFALAVSSQQTTQIGQDILGQALVCLASVYLFVLIFQLFRKLPPVYRSITTHRTLAVGLLALPVTLLFMGISGYFYTSLMLSGYYLATFYVLAAWILTEAGILRGLDFAYERMQERQLQQAALQQTTREFTEDGEHDSEFPPLQPAELTPSPASELEAQNAKQQSKRLARFGVFALFAFILIQVWSEASTALDYLNNQLLWVNPETGVGGLSLGGLVTAVVTAVIGGILVRNLPGLLELTILSRLNLQMGTAYAVTSLVNYVIISVVAVVFLASLGVRWDQLQWLAAGLTVGLGFGLQEIFGNFISGLILFFERPLRVGDVVTLNNLSGRVAKIRIRATVITDFDRRDILVPNRQFITGQFVNWTLSNTITRIVVKVGVAYGSDLQKTKDILTQIAMDEPRVLKDPLPSVLFLNFGASTLEHELRVHVASLGDRNAAMDAINREIDKRFKAAGIEIAFNQIDVHFRNELGVERHIETRKSD